MKNLIIKEFKLAIHPTVIMFFLLAAMLLIPNYPYYVVFFYSSLSLFFVCLTGRENHDIEYSLLLPMKKRDVVRARIAFAVIIQMIELAACVLFAALRRAIGMGENLAGMDANISLFGFSLLLLGIFNFVFFSRYYRAPEKVGKSFAISAVVFFVCMIILEGMALALPFVRDRLDTPDPLFLTEKLITLVFGAVAYAALTFLALKKSERSFEELDL